MTKISYPASSPYSATPQASWYIGNFVYKDIPSATDDSSFTLLKKHEYRPDTLSYELYGTPAYWWIFAVRNRDLITDPIWDMTVGLTIVVPSLATLRKALSS